MATLAAAHGGRLREWGLLVYGYPGDGIDGIHQAMVELQIRFEDGEVRLPVHVSAPQRFPPLPSGRSARLAAGRILLTSLT